MERAKQHIEALCAPTMHGRGYIQKGDSLAAQYIAEAYQNIGLKPLEQSKSNFLQRFKLPINTYPGAVELSLDTKNYRAGYDFIVNSGSKSGRGQAKVLYLDSATLNNSERLMLFLKKDLSQNAVLLSEKRFNGLFKTAPTVLKHLLSAKALLITTSKLTMALSQEQWLPPTFLVLDKFVQNIPKKIKFELNAVLIDAYTSQNVLGYVEGQRQDSTVVFCAHYDHLGRLGNKGAYFPGANDNAAGVALLLEMAAYYQQNKPKFRTVFIAFGAEEVGLIGSEHYVKNPLFPLSHIKFLLNLDLVGTGDTGMAVVNATLFKEQFSKLNAINTAQKYLPSILQRGPVANSDHYHFSERGVPAFFFYLTGGIQAYHDVQDVAETLPLTEFKDFFSLLKDFVNAL